ncbi:hypothetical protein T265_08341 [Opisthorchis viverrini]|uniref:Uncharacterized protein n=1 Tax=Opisthorchis viverrini TaxID=6198 RepID=A0A074Z9T3_OPIVI|nr:hypothetical protein T265_08341 [Opisthorchis viverrini]KER23878.1 hypothetical protein T265_08341 [Opisthorchis viverrini]
MGCDSLTIIIKNVRDGPIGQSANLLTGRPVVRTRPLPPGFPCLGLDNLAVSQPSLGQPGSTAAPVLPSGGVVARHRKGVTAERFFTTHVYLSPPVRFLFKLRNNSKLVWKRTLNRISGTWSNDLRVIHILEVFINRRSAP